MTTRLFYSPVARRDVIEIADYLVDIDPDLPLKFLDALEATADLLKDNPNIGVGRDYNNPLLTDMQMFPISGFDKYLFYYRVVDDVIEVIHIFHGARDLDTEFSSDE